jgi:hypothetical protein
MLKSSFSFIYLRYIRKCYWLDVVVSSMSSLKSGIIEITTTEESHRTSRRYDLHLPYVLDPQISACP